MNDSSQIWLHVGTYNRREPHAPVACGPGLVTCAFDLLTGHIEQRHVFPDIVNSSYLAGDPLSGLLFSTSESLELENAVHMFQCQPDGSLKHLGAQPARGLATCHLALLPGGKVCAASYLQSCISVFPAGETQLGMGGYHFDYQGSGPNPARQEASHAHQVVVAPGQRWFYVVDLGADCVWRHDVDLTLTPVGFPMPSGHGPRHMAFHPELPRAYVLGEMTGAVTVCEWNESSGALAVTAITRELGNDASAAAIRVHPSGKTLWTSLRGARSLQCFQLDPHGLPSEAADIPLGDGEPRDFDISPDGRWLVCANQSANHLAVIELNPLTGLPTERPPTRFELGTPCSILFMPTCKSQCQ